MAIKRTYQMNLQIPEGDIAEIFFAQKYIKAGFQPIKMVGNHKFYDYYIAEITENVRNPHIGMTLEIKRDMSWKYYKNIAIELSSYNKPSGILATTADLWLTMVDEEREYMADVDLLKKFIKNCTRQNLEGKLSTKIFRIHYNGGENNAQINALINLEFLKQQDFWKEFDVNGRPTSRKLRT